MKCTKIALIAAAFAIASTAVLSTRMVSSPPTVQPLVGTSVLHGNAAGAPTFGPVALGTDVSGNLPTSRLNSGTGAGINTYWSGAGGWTTPYVQHFLMTTNGSTLLPAQTSFMAVSGTVVVKNASNEWQAQLVSNRVGTWQYLNCNINGTAGPGAGKSYTFTLRVNGADTALTCTISNTSQNCSDSTHTVTNAVSDLVSYGVVPSGSPNTPYASCDISKHAWQ